MNKVETSKQTSTNQLQQYPSSSHLLESKKSPRKTNQSLSNFAPVHRLAYPLNKNTTKKTSHLTNLSKNTASSSSQSKSTSTAPSQNYTSSYDQFKNIPIPAPNMSSKVKNNSTSTSFASPFDEILKFKNAKDPPHQLMNTSSSPLKNIYLSTDLEDQEEEINSLTEN